MADIYGPDLGGVIRNAAALRQMKSQQALAEQSAALNEQRMGAFQEDRARVRDTRQAAGAFAKTRGDEEFANLMALDPQAAMGLKQSFAQMDDAERQRAAQELKAEAEAGARIALTALQNPENYESWRALMPEEERAQWPEKFDQPGENGLTGEDWLQYEVAQARELDDLMEEWSSEKGRRAFSEAMGFRESSGNYSAQNAEGYTGKYQFGPERLQDFKSATGTNFTMEQFKADPNLQEAAQEWHVDDIDKFIFDRGLNRQVGKQLPKGVTLTLDGMRAAAHLGGKEGLRKYVSSEGEYDPADSNGTRLSDYARQFGGERAAEQQGGADFSGDPRRDEQLAPLMDLYANPDITDAQRDMVKFTIDQIAERPASFDEWRAYRNEGGDLDYPVWLDRSTRLKGGLDDRPERDGDFQYVYDEDTQTFRAEVIPGTKEADEQTAQIQQFAQAAQVYDSKFQVLDEKLTTAQEQLEEGGSMVAGWGSLLSAIPQTAARDFKGVVDFLKANLGFEELAEMRESSPTGGALGQITERELAFLQAAKANLDTMQSPDQLMGWLRDLQARRREFKVERGRIMQDEGILSSEPERPASAGGAVLPPGNYSYNPATGRLEPAGG